MQNSKRVNLLIFVLAPLIMLAAALYFWIFKPAGMPSATPASTPGTPVLCKDEKGLSYSLGWERASPTKAGAVERCSAKGTWERIGQTE